MATGTIVLNSICAGTGHVALDVTIGGTTRTFNYSSDEIRVALTLADMRDAALTLAKFHCGG